jgi:hypothetical protein
MSLDRHVTVLMVFVVWFITSPGSATNVTAQDRLAAATSVTCTFSVMATGTWLGGDAEAELDASTLSLQFESIDTDGATAEIVGPYGPAHIITRLTPEYLHFVQMFTGGPLYTTTIIDRETRDGKFMAVHTRHEYTDVRLTGFTSRPEQYYGECAVAGVAE